MLGISPYWGMLNTGRPVGTFLRRMKPGTASKLAWQPLHPSTALLCPMKLYKANERSRLEA